MASPRNDSYSVASGAGIYGGMIDPSIMPAWLSSASVGQVVTIAGTSGAGGSRVDAFCGFAWRPDTKEIYIGGAGGHSDSGDNRVVSIDLTAGSPSWVIRKAATNPAQYNLGQPYNLDGTPNATHTYNWGNRWIPEQGRLMKFGSYAMYDTVNGSATVDGFLPVGSSGGAWDAAGTWTSPPAGWYGNAKRGQNGGTGDVYAIWGAADGVVRKWSATTGIWTSTTPTNLQSSVIYFPWAYSTVGDFLFGLCFGDGASIPPGGAPFRAVKFDPVANRQDAITFNASAGYTAWQAENGPSAAYAGMEFNPVDGKFYWFAGGNIYTITPNASTVWDIAIYTPSSGSVSTVGASGLNSRFQWAEFGSVKGIVMMPDKNSNLQFLRLV